MAKSVELILLQAEASGPILQLHRRLPLGHGQEAQVPGPTALQEE
jgi:hypothetical protein